MNANANPADLTTPQRRILREALRRWQRLAPPGGDTLTTAWLGLGYRSEYKPALTAGLMQYVGAPPPPRVMGWLVLTDKGAAFLQAWIDEGETTQEPRSVLDQYNLVPARF
jgi:hypothetical protein